MASELVDLVQELAQLTEVIEVEQSLVDSEPLLKGESFD